MSACKQKKGLLKSCKIFGDVVPELDISSDEMQYGLSFL